jgi:tRNA threonylcarbamoyladenosine biosynthesis protein TsaE
MGRAESGQGPSRRFLSRGSEATEALGAALALALEPRTELVRGGVAISLEGDLGAGKTAFVRGVAQGLGSPDAVHSPSFTLMHTYEGRLPVYHFDAWMEGRERAFLEGGGAEWLQGGGLALVEWGGRVESWLPTPRLRVVLAHVAADQPETRRVTLEVVRAMGGPGDNQARQKALVEALEALRVPVGVGGDEWSLQEA